MFPKFERSSGGGIGYPLRYSYASFMATMMGNNLTAMQPTCLPSLGWADPSKRAEQPTPVFWPGEYLWTQELDGQQSMMSQRIRHNCKTKHTRNQNLFLSEKCLETLIYGGLTRKVYLTLKKIQKAMNFYYSLVSIEPEDNWSVCSPFRGKLLW